MLLNLNIFVHSRYFVNNFQSERKKRDLYLNILKMAGKYSVDWHSLSELNYIYTVILVSNSWTFHVSRLVIHTLMLTGGLFVLFQCFVGSSDRQIMFMFTGHSISVSESVVHISSTSPKSFHHKLLLQQWPQQSVPGAGIRLNFRGILRKLHSFRHVQPVGSLDSEHWRDSHQAEEN